MMKYICDMALDDAISQAKVDPEAAAKVLRLAVPYLLDLEQRGELPIGLGKYLAHAFILTTREKTEDRPKMLARTLHLSALRRRPKDHFRIGQAVEDAMHSNPPVTQYAATKRVSRQTGLSQSFCRNSHNLYLKALDEIQKIEDEERQLEREENERIQAELENEYYESRLEDAAKRVEVLLRDARPIEEATYTAACELGLSPNDLKHFLELNPPIH